MVGRGGGQEIGWGVFDLCPGTITCDLAPGKLVTNSILEQLIRRAPAPRFLYAPIKRESIWLPSGLGVNDHPDLQ